MPLVHRYAEAARWLDVSERTIKRMVASGELRAIEVGGSRRIPHRELVDLIDRQLAA
ncbi:MAG TPA: helix-turn-helix domain-containing protein [Aquihabitans sp.]|jgi:excisionase family DNA binding protein|nr:helix-turn-helix domain-containing protein [Aquihabitans sp.]